MRHSFQKRKRPENSVGSPMDAALKFLGYSARSVREVERHLDDRQYGEVEVYETVERLKELGLVDDRAYCEDFIRTRLATKPVSRRKLYEQLMAHEIDRATVEEALDSIADTLEAENARAVADKFARQFAALPAEEREKRVLQRLLARGYAYDDACAAVGASLAEEPE